MREEVYIFSPATVANVCVGFDSLGFALEQPGDVIRAKKTNQPGITIKANHGASLSIEPEMNVVGKVGLSFHKEMNPSWGIEFEVWKGYPPGSGIGSSAASASGAAAAVAALAGMEFEDPRVLNWALDGESLASSARHADNVAPALYGGWVLSRMHPELSTHKVPCDLDLEVVILHPHITVKTADSRRILPDEVSMKSAVQQAINFGSLILALQTKDMYLLEKALQDELIEPYRKELLIRFDETKSTALANGALGGGISGSGPSTFWIAPVGNSKHLAQELESLAKTFKIPYSIHRGPISPQGARILNDHEILQYIK